MQRSSIHVLAFALGLLAIVPTAFAADGMTPLHRAVLQENADESKRLLSEGADPNAATRYEITPLSIACTAGNVPLVKLLLDAGADANQSVAGGETPLMTAARTGVVGVVRQLIAHKANVNAKESSHDQKAIHWAAAEGHAEVVKALIDAGADPSESLPNGFNPLLFAARQGHRDVVAVVLAAGADIESSIAKGGGNRAPRPGTTALMLAVENGHFDLAIDLVSAGADPNDQSSGFAPLHAIAWVRKPNRGDDPDGDPPPYGSGRMTSLEFVSELVKQGADVNLRIREGHVAKGRLDKTDATPLLMAADTADVPLMKLLVSLGGDPHLTNCDGTTVLLAAAGVGTFAPGEEAGNDEEVIEAVKFALELGLDLNATDKNGDTVMHGAAFKSSPKIASFLDQAGADIEVWNRPNRYGWTPYAIAEGYRHGNYRPIVYMMTAIADLMRAEGVEPVPYKKSPNAKW